MTRERQMLGAQINDGAFFFKEKAPFQEPNLKNNQHEKRLFIQRYYSCLFFYR